ncbi:hypothetical protein OPQ81_002154 [Rhizoctonia solani]|nr:hypothetical protein OPQ81_002154 [Rhizoctonia solani]
MFGSTCSDGRTYGSTLKNGTLQSGQPMISEAGEYTLSPAISESEELQGERRVFRPQSVHDYVLPQAVRDAKQAWMVWSQGIAVTTALFAAVEAQLFNLIDETQGPTSGLTQAFRIFSYLGLLSNLLATTSALFVLERVSGLSTRARKLSLLPNSLPRQVADGAPLPPDLLHPLRENALLRAFGMDATWGLHHCHVLSVLRRRLPFDIRSAVFVSVHPRVGGRRCGADFCDYFRFDPACCVDFAHCA